MEYDYREAVKKDVINYIEEEIDFQDYDTIEELRDHLKEQLWIEDRVTGAGSDSYTCNTWQSEEYLCHNFNLLVEALEFSGNAVMLLKDGADACDVQIRCYILNEAIDAALEELDAERQIQGEL